MNKDFFAQKAGDYDKNKSRVENVDNIAKAMLQQGVFDKTMHIIDFGSGTGLLLERIAPHVKKISAIDISTSMNEQLEAKRDDLPCELEILQQDLTKEPLAEQYDGIISSMTLHHVEDIAAIFKTFYAHLKNDGFIALADLDREDGSFHSEDTGVYHSGFDHDNVKQAALEAGFRNIDIVRASVVHKPQGDFPVFLLTGVK